jgi:hypothetical protein
MQPQPTPRETGTTFERLAFKACGSVASTPSLSAPRAESRQPLFNERLAMKTERFAGHHEAREALVLSVASVTAIMLSTGPRQQR